MNFMKSCLVVDDSPLIRKVTRLTLDRIGWRFDESDSGEQALERCAQEMPDVILLDWLMPGMETSHFLKGLEILSRGAKPYIIYCATENDPIEISKAFHAGCDDCLLKPFTQKTHGLIRLPSHHIAKADAHR